MANFLWCERRGNGVAGFKALSYCWLFDAGSFGPLRQREGLAVMGHEMIISPVILLFFLSRPTAIARFVITAVLSAINGVLGSRSFAHVSKKVFKRVKPTLADGNTASAVVVETIVLRAGASANHAVPAFVRSARVSSARVAMLEALLAGPVAQKTPTAFMSAAQEVASNCNRVIPTVAQTFPLNIAAWISAQALNNQEAFKSMIQQIFACRHNLYIRKCVGLVNGGCRG